MDKYDVLRSNTLSRKVLILVSLISLLIIGLETVNISRLIYAVENNLTFLYSFIHVFFEFIRGFVYLGFVVGLVLFIAFYINDKGRNILGLSMIYYFTLIGFGIIFLISFIYFSWFSFFIIPFFIFFLYFISIGLYAKHLSEYLKKKRKLVPIKLFVQIMTILVSTLIIFAYIHSSAGGNFGISGHAYQYYIDIPLSKTIFVFLINISIFLLIEFVHKDVMKTREGFNNG